MKLVVGLGNPGQKYKGTRHNIGFDVVASLAQRFGIDRPKGKFNAEIGETVIAQQKTILLSPLTYMNLSGQSVKAAVDFYKLELADLILVCDDLALDTGRLRIRPSGSAGGQKGLADTIQRLGTEMFARLRVGIGRPPADRDPADYVLGRFTNEEKPIIDKSVYRATEAIEVWAGMGVQSAMNQFNADPQRGSDEQIKTDEQSNLKNKP
jgi:peptidyl-tRNA hydrolase, PTH1 family